MSAHRTRQNEPTGPPAHPLFGNLLELRRDPLGFLSACAHECGDIARYRVLLFPVYLLNHPDYIETVLVTQSRNFKKGRALRASHSLLGAGLLTGEGEEWRQQRHLVQPAFQRDRIALYSELCTTYAEREIASWQDGEAREINRDMMRLTLLILAKALFGANLESNVDSVSAAAGVFLQEFRNRMNAGLLIPGWLPTEGNRRLARATRELETIIYGLIAARRRAPQKDRDLLSALISARDDKGAAMTERQLRDHVMTLLLAGHETTAVALTWTWYLLSQTPHVEEKLNTELQTQLQGRAPTLADLTRLPYTAQVIKEGMRLYPPAWAVARRALNDCEIGGYRIRAGSSIVLSQWVTHHDARYFPNPDSFNPDRWTDDFAKDLPRFAYFPFGGGPRICIGAAFAQMEAVLLLATIASKFRLSRVSPQPVELWPSLTLHPKGGMKMRVHKRQGGRDPSSLSIH